MNCLKCGAVLSKDKCGKCGFDLTSESFVFFHTKKDIKVRLKKYVAMYEETDKGYEDIIMAVEDGEWIGDLLADMSDTEKEEAFAHFRGEAEEGIALAQYTIGDMYLDGIGTETDEEEALKWYLRAAEKGIADACVAVGIFYEEGRGGLEEDEIKALEWYIRGADLGDTTVECHIGELYELQNDYPKAGNWYYRAAEHGDIAAVKAMGTIYRKGRKEIKPRKYKLDEWYEQAEMLRDDDAMKAIGDIAYGEGYYDDAIKWYKNATKQHNRDAMIALGDMYSDEELVLSDLEHHLIIEDAINYLKALKWYKRAGVRSKWKFKRLLSKISTDVTVILIILIGLLLVMCIIFVILDLLLHLL